MVISRSTRTLVGGRREGALVVRVTAPPAEGAANEAVIEAVARALGVPPSAIAIERGRRGRRKLLSAPATAREALDRM